MKQMMPSPDAPPFSSLHFLRFSALLAATVVATGYHYFAGIEAPIRSSACR
jgi:hypothetical protein